MKVLIDTNIILDILLAREPFVRDSVEILRLAEEKKIEGFVTANTIVDIIYITKKYISDKNVRESTVKTIVNILDITGANKSDILKAFDMEFADYEDALQTQCAMKIKADYIITRDLNDFLMSPVKALTPTQFLSLNSPSI